MATFPAPIQPGELLELHVRVVAARGLPLHNSATTFTRMRVGQHEARSQDAEHGGQAPTFNWKYRLPAEATTVAMFDIVHEGGILTAASLVGSAILSAASLTDGQVADIWLPLKKGEGAQEKDVGAVNIRAQLMHQGERPIVPREIGEDELAVVGRAVLAAGLAGAAAPPSSSPPAARPSQAASLSSWMPYAGAPFVPPPVPQWAAPPLAALPQPQYFTQSQLQPQQFYAQPVMSQTPQTYSQQQPTYAQPQPFSAPMPTYYPPPVQPQPRAYYGAPQSFVPTYGIPPPPIGGGSVYFSSSY